MIVALGYENYWDWKEDIEDCWETMNQDDSYEVAWSIARKQVMEEEDISEDDFMDDPYYDDRVQEFASDIIGLYRISKYSDLYALLEEWYASQNKEMQEEIRDFYETDYHIYFVTGCGYSIWSADLLGGGADGRAEHDFDNFVIERM